MLALNPEAPLFVNQLGERIQPRMINQITRKLREKAGIEKPLTPRVCRYTVAKKLFDSEVPLDLIDGLLGQPSMNSTSIYAML